MPEDHIVPFNFTTRVARSQFLDGKHVARFAARDMHSWDFAQFFSCPYCHSPSPSGAPAPRARTGRACRDATAAATTAHGRRTGRNGLRGGRTGFRNAERNRLVRAWRWMARDGVRVTYAIAAASSMTAWSFLITTARFISALRSCRFSRATLCSGLPRTPSRPRSVRCTAG